MDPTIEKLCDSLLLKSQSSSRRVLVGISGLPGSGKTTIAAALRSRLNEKAKSEIVQIVPLDGFHYYREQLDQMPQPKEAHLRRGAPFTFDSHSFVKLMEKIKLEDDEEEILTAPAFDHSKRDPSKGEILIKPHHRIILSEGLYLGLDEKMVLRCKSEDDSPDESESTITECLERKADEKEWISLWVGVKREIWEKVPCLFDEIWFLDCPEEECVRRLTSRHMEAWGISKEEAINRIEISDLLNARLVNKYRSSLISQTIH